MDRDHRSDESGVDGDPGDESESGVGEAGGSGQRRADGPEGWAPWGSLSEIQEAVGGIVDSALRTVAPGGGRFPRYDLVAVPDEGYRVLVDLPGLEKSQVDVTIADRELTVAGERSRPDFPEGADVQRTERVYGKFRRTLRVPDDADPAGVGAKMENGVLTITLPLRAAGEAQTIEVE